MKFNSLFLALAISGSVLSPSFAQTKISIPSQNCLSKSSFLDTCNAINLAGAYYKANSDTVVIITHNSVGVDERHHRYARHLNSLGFSAVVIDHWGARGVSNAQWDFVGAARRGATAHNMVIDVYHSTAYFKQNGYAKVGFIGESMGGGVGVLLSKREWQHHFRRVSGQNPITLDAIAALYGNCNERYVYDNYLSVPLLILIGSEDADAPASTCRSYAEYANGKGAKYEFTELPGQHHDFDASFPLTKAMAQNPSRCQAEVSYTHIHGKLTNKQYPNTPKGWEEWKGDCILKAHENPAKYGHTGNPNTGFFEWGEFFRKILK